MASAEEVRQAVLAVRPDLRLEVVEADGDQLVTASNDAGSVTFTTGAFPQVRPDGQPYYQGWAWRADGSGGGAQLGDRTEHWRALVAWPGDVARALAAL